ncbi:MAG: MFS transporter [Pseudomonadota bacterium]
MIRSLTSLLLSIGLLLAGSGLQGTLISVRADMEGMSVAVIGLMMSAYYGGFVLGCLRTPLLVARVGHIRAFVLLAALAAATALIYPILVNVGLWLVLRAITGFCFAGLFMVIESWISEQADSATRGRILSVYRIVDLCAMTCGQALLNVAAAAGTTLFSVVAILTCLAIVPIAFTKAQAPNPLTSVNLNIRRLLSVSPLAVMGALAAGLVNGALYALGAVYVQSFGHNVSVVTLFFGALIVGGALGQWPLGLLSDLYDRRIVLLLAAFATCITGIVAAYMGSLSVGFLVAGGFIFGLSSMSIFGLCAAHANDHADNQDFVAISAGLLLVFGLGSILGPLIAAGVMVITNPSGLFVYAIGVYAALCCFGLVRLRQSDSVPAELQEEYVAIQPRSVTTFEIDPRNEED